MSLFQQISEEACQGQLRFLVIGGVAVMAHGFARSTFDLDLLVRRSEVGKWKDLAAKLGFQFFQEGPTFVQFQPRAAETLPLDLMLVGEATFEQMYEAAKLTDAGGVSVKVVSLAHLIALKCHAIQHGGPRRAVKDAEDVIQLLKANRIDPGREPLRGVILKHGSPELYDKLRRATAPD
jgi:predicted nucleotidyltransferase